MEFSSRPLNAINQQENLFYNKGKIQTAAKGGLQNATTKRAVLGDINSNIRIPPPPPAAKGKLQTNEVVKPSVQGTRPNTRSYKNINARVDTRMDARVLGKVPNIVLKAPKDDLQKLIPKDDSASVTSKAAGALTARLRKTKISNIPITKTSSQESLQQKESAKNSAKVSSKDVIIHVRKDSDAKDQKNSISKQITRRSEAYSSELLEEVEDIDSGHRNSPILMGIYVKDIYNYLIELEVQYPIKEKHLDGQICMTANMRSMLIDWLVEVHEQFSLMLETLHLTVAIIDRYIQAVRTIQRKQIQLIGITAMFIASKYEEMFMPDIQDFVYITDNSYTKSEILRCEQVILSELDFCLGRPLPLHFERRFIKAAKVLHVRNHHLAKYLIDLCLVEYDMAHYRPSEIAAAAVCLSISLLSPTTLPDKCWTPTLVYYSGYKYELISDIIKKMANVAIKSSTSRYKAVSTKYNSPKHGKVPLFRELKGDLIKSIAGVLTPKS